MKQELLDRRVRKTRRILRECLTRLLKEKKIQDITVRELADMADINRGTFYLHYKDVFDLLEQIEQELTEELEDILDHHSVDELLSRPSLLFSDLYPTVQENADIITILIGENGDLNFVNRIKAILRDRCLKKWLTSNYSCSTDLLEAYSAFIISGCVGIVQYWLETGMKESPEQMAKATEDFILRGIRVLEK
ncbi:MAG: TetR/AcrR family transcriptional regulator [Otoolea sp.]|nr:TetR/AcrR family transcriptional regulator [Clostridiaceae bacterium]MDY5484984.1 TetR/AcrR family transcriptional regulator C-terminal domain-containing protein [Clostridium sp.]